MKILVFSDTHLGKDFDEKKFKFLRGIISKVDRVIINGDFWEGHLVSFAEFLSSPWRHLFPLLKQKKTVYLFGNHDKKEFADTKKLNLFSEKQAERYKLKLDGKLLILEHGDRLFTLLQGLFKIKTPPSFLVWSFERLEKIMLKTMGKELFKSFCRRYNQKIKKKIKKELKEKQIFICGHTHASEIDYPNNFINTGFVKHGLGQYLLIDTDKHQIIPKEEQYS